MKVLNAGLEMIEFSYNSNARDMTGKMTGEEVFRKLGGVYRIHPGHMTDVPEEARDVIFNPDNGPGMKGLVILKHGDNITAKKSEGLLAYKKYLETRLYYTELRKIEKEAVGIKSVADAPEVIRWKRILEEINKHIGAIAESKEDIELKEMRAALIQQTKEMAATIKAQVKEEEKIVEQMKGNYIDPEVESAKEFEVGAPLEPALQNLAEELKEKKDGHVTTAPHSRKGKPGRPRRDQSPTV